MLVEFLEDTKYVDFNHPIVKALAERLKAEYPDELSLIEASFLYVRDRIQHSWDAQDKRVTVTASDVLREGVGICWAKANLLAALLISVGEVDYHDNHAEPDKNLMKVREESEDALDMYLNHLPDQLSYTD